MQRRTAGAGSSIKREKFAYDYLNRLAQATTFIWGAATASRSLDFAYDLRGNLESKTGDVSGDEDTTGYDYHPGTNRLKKAAIGDVE